MWNRRAVRGRKEHWKRIEVCEIDVGKDEGTMGAGAGYGMYGRCGGHWGGEWGKAANP